MSVSKSAESKPADRPASTSFFVFLLVAMLGSCAWADELPIPVLALDLAPGEVDGSAFHSGTSSWVELDGVLYFVANAPRTGAELWRTDGSMDGTWQVRDLCPGPCHGFPGTDTTLRVFGDRLVFVASDGALGGELWSSDGTAEGTRPLADLNPGPVGGLGSRSLEVIGERLFFRAFHPPVGEELWVLRQEGGPPTPLDVCLGPCNGNPTVAVGSGSVSSGEQVFFTAADQTTRALRLFVTDGSPAGTRRLTEEPAAELAALGAGAVFSMEQPETGYELWITDGTPNGTRLLVDLCPGPCSGLPNGFQQAGEGILLFNARTHPDGPADLLRTDGTAAGTWRVAPDHRRSRLATPIGDAVAFVSESPECDGLWTTRGTPDTTHPLLCGELPTALVAHEGQLIVGVRQGLFAGSPESLEEIFRFEGRYILQQLASFGGQVLLKGFSAEHGIELWASDGTSGGTAQLRNIHRGAASSAPHDLIELQGALLLKATAGNDDAASTWRLDDPALLSGPLRFPPRRLGPFIRHGDALLFSSLGRDLNDELNGLWRTDGTESGTVRLGGALHSLIVGGGFARRFFFTAWPTNPDDGSGLELWVTNGRPNGARFLGDLYPGFSGQVIPDDNSSVPTSFTPLGQRVLFAASNAEGRELWTSDGTPEGTAVVRDLCRGCSGYPRDLTRLGKQIVFTAHHPRLGRELWRTDGTFDGTRPVRDLRRGAPSSAPHDLATLRDRIVFAAGDTEDGESLWRTDATLRGTRRLAGLGSGAFTTESLRVGRQVFFAVADPVAGPSLWVSNGRRRGTRKLLTLRNGPGGVPRSFTEVDGRLLFAADDGIHGEELWRSDGTAEGTFRLTDLAPGPASSAPREITAAGERIYFVADDGIQGRELWSIERAALP